jgi:hypothetical protein
VKKKEILLDYWLARLKDLPVSAERPLKDRLTVRDDGGSRSISATRKSSISRRWPGRPSRC